jgi:hypothetical protein
MVQFNMPIESTRYLINLLSEERTNPVRKKEKIDTETVILATCAHLIA